MRISPGSGFNPCFIGLASATLNGAEMKDNEVGFNPCFIGLASATKHGTPKDIHLLGFQSLFYWISLCNRNCKLIGYVCEEWFQSLFYWISLCNSG